jgi:hypothetical protein
MLTLGLRFSRSQARILDNIAEDLRSRRPDGIDISLFDKAAESARDGEPLVVLCDHREEIEKMARGFELWGIKRPVIEELSPA